MRLLDGITNSMDMGLGGLQELVVPSSLNRLTELDTADSKFPKNNLGKHCLGYVTLRGHASLKTTLISEDR